jgi:hypothetical protein
MLGHYLFFDSGVVECLHHEGLSYSLIGKEWRKTREEETDEERKGEEWYSCRYGTSTQHDPAAILTWFVVDGCE